MPVTNDFTQSELDLNGQANINSPTALVWGPDGRLYVTEVDGDVKILTVAFGDKDPGDSDPTAQFYVTASETLNQVKAIQNYNDDGTTNGSQNRQVTGIDVVQQHDENGDPVLFDGVPAVDIWVTSSDSRIGAGSGGNDANLDTNSGVITRLRQTEDGWDAVDMVRGLARSEENHATNGLEIIQVFENGQLVSERAIVASGGNANTGAPSNNFAGQQEQPLSGAILEVDITELNGMTVLTDGSGRQYVYDLPTLDDPTRDDANDPFGGNDGLNSAKLLADSPVQIYSAGYRNPYDVEVTEDGRVWTYDNGANNNWGGRPAGEDEDGDTNATEPESGVPTGFIATNLFVEDNDEIEGNFDPQNWDQLHEVTRSDDLGARELSAGLGGATTYTWDHPDLGELTLVYGGHPNPTRAEGARAGLLYSPNSGVQGAKLMVSNADKGGGASDFLEVVAWLQSIGYTDQFIAEFVVAVDPGVTYADTFVENYTIPTAAGEYSLVEDPNGPIGLPADIDEIVNALNPVEGNYLEAGYTDGAIDTGKGSINGLAEYTSTIFEEAGQTGMVGAIVAASLNQGQFYIIGRDGDGIVQTTTTQGRTIADDRQFLESGGAPLGLASIGDDLVPFGGETAFRGSMWAAIYKQNGPVIEIFQPGNAEDNALLGVNNYAGQEPADPTDNDLDGVDHINDPFDFDADNGLALGAGQSIVINFSQVDLAATPEFSGTVGDTGLLGAALDGVTPNRDARTGTFDDNNDGVTDRGDGFPPDVQENGLFDNAGNIIPGGNAPLLQIKSVQDGTALDGANSLRDGLQTGVRLDSDVQRMIAEVEVFNWWADQPGGGRVTGLMLGDGTQSNFVRLVFGDIGGGQLGLEIGIEEEDSYTVLQTVTDPALTTALETGAAANQKKVTLQIEVADIGGSYELNARYGFDGQAGYTEIDLPGATIPEGVLRDVLDGTHEISDGDTTLPSGASVGIVAEKDAGTFFTAVDFDVIRVEGFGNEINAATESEAEAPGTPGTDTVRYTGPAADILLDPTVENIDLSATGADVAVTGNDSDNVVTVGAGTNTITTGAGADEVRGTLANLGGDTITDFSTEDSVLIEDLSSQDITDVEYAAGSAILTINGQTLTFDGDFFDGFDPADGEATFDFVDTAEGVRITAREPLVPVVAINAGGTGGESFTGTLRDTELTFIGDGGGSSSGPGFETTGNNKAYTNATASSFDFPDTDLDSILASERSNAGDFGYTIEVPNGTYLVDMVFAEIYHGFHGGGADNTGTGFRTFDVELEGTEVISNLDVQAEAGGAGQQLIRSVVVEVTDGVLDINFSQDPEDIDQAKLSGLAVWSVGGGFAPADTTAPVIEEISLENPQNVQDGERTATVVLSDAGGFDADDFSGLDGSELTVTGVDVDSITYTGVTLSDGDTTATLTYEIAAAGGAWEDGTVGEISVAAGAFSDAAGNGSEAGSGGFVVQKNLDDLERGTVVRAINLGTTLAQSGDLAFDPVSQEDDDNAYGGALTDTIITDAFGNPVVFEADSDAYHTSPKPNQNANIDGKFGDTGSNAGGIDLDGSAYHTYRDSAAASWTSTYDGFANGVYVVELHFAELFHGDANGENAAGQRVGDFTVNGVVFGDDYDPAGEGRGADTPSVLTQTVTVTDGTIQVLVDDVTAGQPGYSAIVVYEAVDPAAPATISVADVSVAEGEDAVLTFSRTGDLSEEITVDYTLSAGTADAADFGAGTPDPVVFAVGQATATVTVPIVDDEETEGAETIAVTIDAVSSGQIGVGAATISIAPSDSDLQVPAGGTLLDLDFETAGDPIAEGGFDALLGGATALDTSPLAGGEARDVTVAGGKLVIDTSNGDLSQGPGDASKNDFVKTLDLSDPELNDIFVTTRFDNPFPATLAAQGVTGEVIPNYAQLGILIAQGDPATQQDPGQFQKLIFGGNSGTATQIWSQTELPTSNAQTLQITNSDGSPGPISLAAAAPFVLSDIATVELSLAIDKAAGTVAQYATFFDATGAVLGGTRPTETPGFLTAPPVQLEPAIAAAIADGTSVVGVTSTDYNQPLDSFEATWDFLRVTSPQFEASDDVATATLTGPETVAEGDAATYEVVLSADPSEEVSVTVDVTGAGIDPASLPADAELAAGGTQLTLTFAPGGALTQSFSVDVADDTLPELAEGFAVTVSGIGITPGGAASVATTIAANDGPVDSVNGTPVAGGDFADDGTAPTDIGTLAEGITTVVASQQGDSAPGGRERDYITFTVAEGQQLSGIVLRDWQTAESGTPQAFIGLDDGSVIAVDPVTFDGAEGLLGGYVYNTGDIVNPAISQDGNMLDELGDGDEQGTTFGDGTGFSGPLPAGTYTIWLNQGGDISTATLELVTEAPDTGPSLVKGDFVWGINAGNDGQITDTAGNVYDAAIASEWPGAAAYQPNSADKVDFTGDGVDNADDSVYESEFYGDGADLVFTRTDIPAGDYILTFKLAEIFANLPNSTAGEREFDLFVNGELVADDLNLVEEVGIEAAYDLDVQVTIPDEGEGTGTLTVTGVGVIENAKINALALYQAVPDIVDPVEVTASDDTFRLPEDSVAVPLAVLLNDSDTEGGVISIESVGQAQHGSVQLVDGELYYSPDPDYVGTDTFTYVSTNGETTDEATVSLTVVRSHEQPQSTQHPDNPYPNDYVNADEIAPEISPSGKSLVLTKVADLPNEANGAAPRMNSFDTVGERIFVSTEGTQTNSSVIYELVADGAGGRTVEVFFDIGAAYADGAADGRALTNSGGAIVQQGLRGIAFHPDFETNGKLYTSLSEERPSDTTGHPYLSDVDGNALNYDSVVIEWTIDESTGLIDPDSYREVFRIGNVGSGFNHPIRQIEFNPHAEPGDDDYGLLYVATGDGTWNYLSQGANASQNNDGLGKILRVDPTEQTNGDSYGVPADNPFVGDATMNDAVYALGFRNPGTITFATDGSGDTVILTTSVGFDNFEEVNLIEAGGNYGWPTRSGPFIVTQEGGNTTGVLPLPADEADFGFTYPVTFIAHDPFDSGEDIGFAGDIGAALTGGHVIQNGSELDGEFIFADFAENGRFFHVSLDDLLSQTITLEPGQDPDALTFATPSELTILLDHDGDPTTTPIVQGNFKDIVGSFRTDVRFGEGPDGELWVLNKRNGEIYVASNTLEADTVNDAPRGVVVSTVVGTLEEVTDTSAPIKVANITVVDDPLGTNVLSLGGDDANLFEIVGRELFLQANVALDAVNNPSLDVTVLVDDPDVGAAVDASATFSVSVVPEVATDPTDVDADGLLNNLDPAAYDAANGMDNVLLGGQTISLDFDTDTTDPLDGSSGLTGVQIVPGNSSFGPFDDPDDPYGSLTTDTAEVSGGNLVIQTTTGDIGGNNSGQDNYQTMLDVSGQNSVTFTTKFANPFDASTQPFSLIGFNIGTGTQSDFYKMLFIVTGSGVNVQVAQENAGSTSETNTLIGTLLDEGLGLADIADVVLSMTFDRTAGTITPEVTFLDESGAEIGGGTLAASAPPPNLLAALNGENPATGGTGGVALAVDTSNIIAPDSFTAEFDYLRAVSNDAPVGDPTVALTGAANVTEGDSGTTTVEYTVTLSQAPVSDVDVTVNLTSVLGGGATVPATVPGDVAFAGGATSQTLTFTPGGALTQTVTVEVAGDAEVEPNETFSISLDTTLETTEGATDEIVVTIDNDDADTATVAVGDVSVDEDAGVATVTFTRTGDDAEDVTVTYSTVDGTATAGTDYTAVTGGTAVIPAGGTGTITVDIPLLGDTDVEGDEAFSVVIDAAVAPTRTVVIDDAEGIVTLTDNDVPPPPQDASPEGDLDGDGVLNADDDDIDGDGVLNTDETFVYDATDAGTALVNGQVVRFDFGAEGDDPITPFEAGFTGSLWSPNKPDTPEINLDTAEVSGGTLNVVAGPGDHFGGNNTQENAFVAAYSAAEGLRVETTFALPDFDPTSPGVQGPVDFQGAGVVIGVDQNTMVKAVFGRTGPELQIVQDNAGGGAPSDIVTPMPDGFDFGAADIADVRIVLDVYIDDTSGTPVAMSTATVTFLDSAGDPIPEVDALTIGTIELEGTLAQLVLDGAPLGAGTIQTSTTSGQVFDVAYDYLEVTALGEPPADVPPTVALETVVASLPEDADTTQSVKIADIVVTDDGLSAVALSVTGDDAGLFTIVDGTAGPELHLVAGTVLDFETAASLSVGVTATDGAGTGSADLTLPVDDVNEAPTVTLENALAEIAEDADLTGGVKIADIVVADDALGTADLALDGADAGLFEIRGTELFLSETAVLDFESATQLDVTVTVDDAEVGVTPDGSAALTLAVGDVTEREQVADAPGDLPGADGGTNEIDTVVYTGSEDVGATGAAYQLPDAVENFDATGTGTVKVAGNAGDNAIGVGSGAEDEVDLTSGGSDSVTGTGAELDGTTIAGFESDDRIVVEGGAGASIVSVERGSTVLGIDTDDDGEADSTVTLVEDYDEEDLVVTEEDGNLVIGVAPAEPPATVRIEAEDLTNAGGYETEGNGVASEDALIFTRTAGTAGIALDGLVVPGMYNVTVGYFDENDGTAQATLTIDERSETWIFDADTTSNGAAAGSARTITFAAVTVDSDSTLTLSSLREQGEFARIDYVEFTPIDTGEDLPPIVVAAPEDATVPEGMAFELDLNGVFDDADTPELTYTLDPAAPAWLSIDPATGILSGTPADGDLGGPVTVTASDGTSSVSTTFDVTVEDVVTSGPIRVQAEDLTLSGAFFAQSLGAADGQVIRVTENDTGTATFDLAALEPGTYAIRIAYFDENDGESTATVTIGDRSESWVWNDDATSGNGGQAQNIRVRSFDSFEIAGGSLTLTVTGDAGELGRVDYIEFVPEEGDPDNLPPFAAFEIPPQSATEGTPYDLDFAEYYVDPEEQPLTLSVLSGPDWLSIVDGRLVGTPPDDTETGDITVEFAVSDGNTTITDSLVISVTGENDAPETPGIPAQVVNDSSVEIDLSAFFSDPDGDTLSYSLTGAPEGLSVDASGLLSGPAPATGPYQMTVTVTDGTETISTDLVLNVVYSAGGEEVSIEAEDFDLESGFFVETQPAASGDAGIRLLGNTSGSASYTFDDQITAGLYNVRVDYFDENDGVSAARLLASTDGGATFEELGAWLFDDTTGGNAAQAASLRARVFSGLEVGEGVILRLEADAEGGEFARIDGITLIPVSGANFAPVAEPGFEGGTFAALDPISIDLGDAFSDPEEDPLTFTLVSGPEWLSVENGALVGTPDSFGTFEVTVAATDGPDNSGITSTATFAITFVDDNAAPVVDLPLGTITLDEGQILETQAIFSDPDGDTLTYSLGEGAPAWLSIDPELGVLSGSPGPDDVGTVSVEVIATDDGALSATDIVTLVIENVNQAPEAGAPLADVDLDGGAAISVAVPADAFTDADLGVVPGETLTLSATLAGGGALPDWITFDPATGTFSGTALANQSLDITVTATDAEGETATQTFTLAVGDTPDLREPIVIEAEDFTGLADSGFVAENISTASGGRDIRAPQNSTVSVTTDTTAVGATGFYTVTVRYFDETDGSSIGRILVGGEEIGTWAFEEGTPVFGGPTGTSIQRGNIREISFDTVFTAGDLTVEVTAGGGELGRVDLIELTPADDPAPRLTTTALAADENAAAAGVIDAPGATSFALVDGEGDNALFSIDDTGALTFLAAPDFEAPGDGDTDNVYEVVVEATNANGTATGTVEVTVADVNEAPGLTVTPILASLTEDTDTSAPIAVADIVVTDDALGTNTLTLTGADASLFEIVGGQLVLRAGTVLDAATNGVLDVSVVLDDATLGTAEEATESLSVAVTTEDGTPAPEVVLRVNAFGPEVQATDGGPNWLADTEAAPSEFLTTTNNRGDAPAAGYSGSAAAIPEDVPEAVLDTARSSDASFSYDVPVENGTYQVNLYVAELFSGGQSGGFRVFDFSVEGSVPAAFDNVDPGTAYGADVGVLTTTVEVTDGVLNLGVLKDTVEGIQNPILNAFELVKLPDIDLTPPSATLAIVNPETADGPLGVEVTLADPDDVDPETFDAGDLAFSIGGFEVPAAITFDGYEAGVASYSVAAPDGGWVDDTQVGVTLQDGAIADAASNGNAEVTVGAQIEIGGGSTGGGDGEEGPALLRINAFGPEVAAIDGGVVWQADGEGAANSPYLVVTEDRGDAFGFAGDPATIPGDVPVAVMNTARSSDLPFGYDIPVSDLAGNGNYTVTLHLAELFDGNTAPGNRVFDVAIEGQTFGVLDNIDPALLGGGQDATELKYNVTVSDGTLDIDFLQDLVDNPIVNGIEIASFSGEVEGPPDPVDPTGALEAFASQSDLVTSASYTGGEIGSAYLSIMTGNNNVQASNFGGSSFEVTNTGDKTISAIFIDVEGALYPDSVFDPDGQGGDGAFKNWAIDSDGDTGAYITGTGYFLPGIDPIPNTGGAGGASNGGFKGAMVKFNPANDGGFNSTETVGFSGDMDPNSVAGMDKGDIDGSAILSWDVGGISGHELIGSTFTVLFDDGSTASGSLASDGSSAGSHAIATEAPTATAPGLTVNGVNPGGAGTYGGTVPSVIVSGDPGDVVRITLSKGFNPVVEQSNGIADIVNARLERYAFEANNAFDVQSVEVTIGAGGTFDASTLFDYDDPINNNVGSGSFAGDDVQPIAFVATKIEAGGQELPLGPTSRPIYLENVGGPVVGDPVTPAPEGYYQLLGSGNAAYFKIQIEDAGTNPGGKWSFLDAPDSEGRQSGFQGEGYYLFGSNTSTGIDNQVGGNEMLEYTIFVPEGETGTYNFVLRASRDGTEASDQQNDIWLNFKHAEDPGVGDIEEFLVLNGNEAEPTADGFVKLFGGPNNGSWGNATGIDGVPGNPNAQLQISEPGLYTIQIDGRSQGFHLDSFVLEKAGGSSPGNGSANSPFVTTGDTLPTVVDPIDDLSVVVGNGTTIDAGDAFEDLDLDPLTFSLNGAPSGVSIDPGTGVVSIGDGLSIGTYQITVSATDDDANVASDTFTLNVTEQPTGGTITATIASGSDDTDQNAGGGAVNVTKTDLELGDSGRDIGLRFTGLDLEFLESVTITGAYLEFTNRASGGSSGTIEAAIALEDSVSTETFSQANAPLTRDQFDFVTDWVDSDVPGGGETFESADFTEMLEAFLTDKAGGLSSSDDLVFVITDEAGIRKMSSFEGGSPAELVIEWDAL
ncbi:Quinoprotein glucose dehydrogenase B precursor [Roseivivax jejudonensis]|uniref:Quinoprotein glucose dehydrogenase B n=1 Tax=Roseivivax jejudonensis TaxID=1529041 RepID=A0A1X6ZY23_9RHOB|nr:malectin domain-containing carbohydrate-binding protein [Roseivivax jejudonensis]SLN64974.1 Quinoprotein glucose dehydrogenase B precursor [Roseivivax jejudonensis]